MSSFIGHSLAGLMIYTAGTQHWSNQAPRQVSPLGNLLWLVGLVAIASFPDIDYLVPALRPSVDGQTFRMTHSLMGALLLPIGTLLLLRLWRSNPEHSTRSSAGKAIQLILAGLSHLGLDLLTGVSALPLLFPLNNALFRLPFGVLPSAGRIRLDNYFLYHNLLIELGVLIPITVGFTIWLRNRRPQPVVLAVTVVSLLVSACFMVWAATLDR
ncbi:MAG: metal-dependent hydrolase [Cyanobacteria bacterium J06559_3]